MKMRSVSAVLVILAVLAAVPALAGDELPMDLAIYPGGESTLEINLSNEDLLPTLQAMLPLLMQKSKMAEKISPEDIAAALKDVKRIQVLQLDVKANPNESRIVDYYSKNMPSGDWNRVFWQSRQPLGTIAVYTQGTGDALYGFRVQSITEDDKTIKRITIAKIEGKIDLAKLLMIASKLLPA